jgi:hypothetical protein
MRSALTDPPVASFTTLPLKATQHATGLMVKVAPLLPSRDLLSSQRQLTWTHTSAFAKAGQDIAISTKTKWQQWFGLDKQGSTFNLNFNKIISISSGFGQTEY